MPPIMEVSVVPIGKEGAGLGDVVAETLKVAERHGVNYQLNAMGTTIEGDLDALFRVAREMHEVSFRLGYPRVVTTIKVDDRRDRDLSMAYKVESVMAKLGRQA